MENSEPSLLEKCTAAALEAYAHLGPEHEALCALERQTKSAEKRATVSRMSRSLAEAARMLAAALDQLALAHGRTALGISGNMPLNAAGDAAYVPMGALGIVEEAQMGFFEDLAAVAEALEAAYVPTKKHPGLAIAHEPQHMRLSLQALEQILRDATELSRQQDALVEQDDDSDTERLDALTSIVAALRERICTTPHLPHQGGPAPEDVVQAIQHDPAVAAAARRALAAMK